MSTGDQGEGPRYYPSGPSGGHYAQYPQNPYGPNTSGNPYPQQPQPQPYAYSPYSQGAFEPEPAAPPRPGAVLGAFVLLVLSALPFLVFGVLGLFVPITQDMFPPELGLGALLTQYEVSFDQFLQAVRLIIAMVAVLALLHIGLSVAALTGKNWGRIGVTALTVLFCGFLILSVAGSGVASLVIVVPVVLAVGGIVLLFLRPSSDWFAARR